MREQPAALPSANARHDPARRRKIRAAIAARNLASAANNTRWNALIAHFRALPGWRPSFRSQSVMGHRTDWDCEWYYHLPFPFAGVEWFDIGLREGGPNPVDHTDEIVAIVARIGFAYALRGDVLRIWGYLPGSYEDLPPA